VIDVVTYVCAMSRSCRISKQAGGRCSDVCVLGLGAAG
jgi:hypothetical protein